MKWLRNLIRRQQSKPIADVRSACGRYYLDVAGIVVAVEGDACRDRDMPPWLYDRRPLFEGDRWSKDLLEHAAERINAAAEYRAMNLPKPTKDTSSQQTQTP